MASNARHLITGGFGAAPGSVKWLITGGLGSPALSIAATGTVYISGAAGFTGDSYVFTATGTVYISGAAAFATFLVYRLELNGVTLPHPDRDGVTVRLLPIGAAQRGGLGSVNFVRGVKAQIGIRWSLCTAAERAILRAAWADCVANARLVRLPDATTYTVLAAAGFNEQQIYDSASAPYYTIALELTEV